MNGKLYGIGVGPGDSELITLKALRIIKETDIIAVPGENPREAAAYKIAEGAWKEIDNKNVIAINMPMTKDAVILKQNHQKGADRIEQYLKQGKSVAFLTLGDPTIYSTYMYLHKIIAEKGYETEIISGITSFCATAARLNMDLSEMSEAIHIIPATYNADKMDEVMAFDGTKVLMKTGKKMNKIKDGIIKSGNKAVMVENCGMPNEKVYRSVEEIPDNAGYYSLIIVKEKKQ